jgi:hypothetical protein
MISFFSPLIVILLLSSHFVFVFRWSPVFVQAAAEYVHIRKMAVSKWGKAGTDGVLFGGVFDKCDAVINPAWNGLRALIKSVHIELVEMRSTKSKTSTGSVRTESNKSALSLMIANGVFILACFVHYPEYPGF